MGLFEMIAIVTVAGSVAGVASAAVDAWRKVAERKVTVNSDALIEEMRSLREELQQFRKQSHDVILSFDGTVQHLDRRVQQLEQNRLTPGAAAESRPELLVGHSLE